MPTPRRLLVFTASTALPALAQEATATLGVSLEITADPDLLAKRLTLNLPILIGGDLLAEAAAAIKQVEQTVLAARSADRTALGVATMSQGLGFLQEQDIRDFTILFLDPAGTPTAHQVQTLTAWLADQVPPLFDPATLPAAKAEILGVPMPEGQWTYLYDSTHAVYGPGLWPFRDEINGRPAGIRMAPSTEHYAWNNEYASLSPSFWTPDIIESKLRLYAGFDGLKHWVHDGKIRLDLAADRAEIHPDIPKQLRAQAQLKADRLLAAVAEHRAARDAGATAPVTAWEIFHPDLAAKRRGGNA